MTPPATVSMRQMDILNRLGTGPATAHSLAAYIGGQEGTDGPPLASVRRDICFLNRYGYSISRYNGLYTWQQRATTPEYQPASEVSTASL